MIDKHLAERWQRRAEAFSIVSREAVTVDTRKYYQLLAEVAYRTAREAMGLEVRYYA